MQVQDRFILLGLAQQLLRRIVIPIGRIESCCGPAGSIQRLSGHPGTATGRATSKRSQARNHKSSKGEQ
jgi:hypothetical protein